jgi:hypothetical protein
MIERLRGSNLESLGHAGSHTMTIIATQSFVPVMLRMTEANAKSRGHLARAHVTTRLVAHSAGRNLLVAGFRSGAVALKASNVCIQSRGNCHGYARPRRSMTSNATNAAHLRVTTMIELHVEAAQSRKRLQLA